MINSSNFFLNNFFELENSPCECKKETVYTAPGVDPSYVLKVCAKPDSDTLRFSYSAQKGLNQSGNNIYFLVNVLLNIIYYFFNITLY